MNTLRDTVHIVPVFNCPFCDTEDVPGTQSILSDGTEVHTGSIYECANCGLALYLDNHVLYESLKIKVPTFENVNPLCWYTVTEAITAQMNERFPEWYFSMSMSLSN